jgi:hypothetical protein
VTRPHPAARQPDRGKGKKQRRSTGKERGLTRGTGGSEKGREEELARAGAEEGKRAGCRAVRGEEGRKEEGPREEVGQGGKERREGVLGWAEREWAALFYSLSFPFSLLQPFKQSHLNSNKFEFKPNTIKIMHQRECAIKLIL